MPHRRVGMSELLAMHVADMTFHETAGMMSTEQLVLRKVLEK